MVGSLELAGRAKGARGDVSDADCGRGRVGN